MFELAAALKVAITDGKKVTAAAMKANDLRLDIVVVTEIMLNKYYWLCSKRVYIS